ncbi:uncharacterized protein SPAPADRAFT_59057 [Spathaspora passalidarum NRRL Y-27907]|uniref:Uncharacterized protein n=1 Tax=Spathaspora passalidarum (strain NRRL Y-27907 / 11-Y1) TaxID=619300 RepID=G3AIB8_SPAPN|nr:uncharacterized protein SPAPADRAFT_59057 [Spathaspora passalidarum NRRL Y-27907]EGW33687.1 hypothetical protein SPAPADRAFT_59057 [Spathaspora passalidarum NRRL Y-27907]
MKLTHLLKLTALLGAIHPVLAEDESVTEETTDITITEYRTIDETTQVETVTEIVVETVVITQVEESLPTVTLVACNDTECTGGMSLWNLPVLVRT